MPRPLRADIADIIYHVINRANARQTIFNHEKDYQAFIDTLTEAKEKFPVEILAFCIMPNHWHFILKPLENGSMSQFMRWLTMTSTQRWHAAHRTVGTGHLYQGRFKSFPVQTDEYFVQLARYVERNPLRAKLVSKAEYWSWSSLAFRERGNKQQQSILSPWPIPQPSNYLDLVNQEQPKSETIFIKQSIIKSSPLGNEDWVRKTAESLGLESTLHTVGRPRKNGS